MKNSDIDSEHTHPQKGMFALKCQSKGAGSLFSSILPISPTSSQGIQTKTFLGARIPKGGNVCIHMNESD